MFGIEDIRTFSRHDAQDRIRGLCQAVYLGDHEVLARCLGRYKMFLDGRDAAFAPHIIMDGFWEYWITQYMARTAKPGMTALDVGANCGYYSVLLADLVGESGRLIAVEPNPVVAAKLRKTLSINGFDGRAKVEEVALTGAAEGEVTFFVPQGQQGYGHIIPGGRPEGGVTIAVRTTNIDTLCAKLDRVDFIKVDAEGAEGGIIEGMKETIARHRPTLLLELNVSRAYEIAEVYALLARSYRSIGYVDYDSHVKPITLRDLQTRNVGQEWMIQCSA